MIDAGRLDEVRYELDRNGNLEPYARADALVALGRLEDAVRVLSAWRDAASDEWKSDVGPVALLGVVYARLTRTEQAERMIAAAIPKAENPTKLSHVHHAQFHIGATLGLLGRHDEAVRWLRKAAEDGYPSYPRFSTDQSLAPLKGHAGFDALIGRLRQDWDRWKRL